MHTCSSCHQPHSRFRDRAHTQPAHLCHACHAAYMREHRPKHSRLSPLSKLKANARAYTRVLLRRGHLSKSPCPCGNPNVQAHHPDYSNPRLVLWLCKPCHLALHASEGPEHVKQSALHP